jgi:predicted transcriptional regulator
MAGEKLGARNQAQGEALEKVAADYLVCLECGAKQKTLKRHIMSSHGLTPDEYRSRYNLPASYPMVAPDYAKQRSTLAKKLGLGRKAAK